MFACCPFWGYVMVWKYLAPAMKCLFNLIIKSMSLSWLFEFNNLALKQSDSSTGKFELKIVRGGRKQNLTGRKLSKRQHCPHSAPWLPEHANSEQEVLVVEWWIEVTWICKMGAGLAPRVIFFDGVLYPSLLALQSSVVPPHFAVAATHTQFAKKSLCCHPRWIHFKNC